MSGPELIRQESLFSDFPSIRPPPLIFQFPHVLPHGSAKPQSAQTPPRFPVYLMVAKHPTFNFPRFVSRFPFSTFHFALFTFHFTFWCVASKNVGIQIFEFCKDFGLFSFGCLIWVLQDVSIGSWFGPVGCARVAWKCMEIHCKCMEIQWECPGLIPLDSCW